MSRALESEYGRKTLKESSRIWAVSSVVSGGSPVQVGGMPDHIHILSSLPKTLSLADFVRTIKADSSKWIKTLDDCYQSFAWQEGYGAFSVSASQMKNTISYIMGQAEHHKKRTFIEEDKLFLEAYGIDYDEMFAFRD